MPFPRIHEVGTGRGKQEGHHILHTQGLKRFKRLHFGVNSAAEVVAQGPHAVSIYNDTLVFGSTPEEHDEALRHVLQLWREQGLTLSLKKSRLNLRAVNFFGKVFSSEGISPNPDMVAL